MRLNRSPVSGFRLRRRPFSLPAAAIATGTDLVWIPDVAASVGRFGERYLRRVFSPQELADSEGPDNKRMASLAARFAAKESVMKLLALQADTAFPWTSVEVVRAGGKPVLKLHGIARQLARRAGWRDFAVSLSHDHEYALANVVASRRLSG